MTARCGGASLSRRFFGRLAVGSLSLAIFSLSARAATPKRTGPSVWERSLVRIEVTRQQYDYYQPWAKRPARQLKTGLAVGERQILTTADGLFDRTLVRLQKGGRGRWHLGKLAWIDYHANLALVTSAEADFWRGIKPCALGGGTPAEGTLQLLRWRDGTLEKRWAEFTRFAVREGQLSSVNHVVLEADSEVQGAGGGEPLIAHGRVVGLVAGQDGRTCTATPVSFIRAILDARARGRYRGLGYFHFYWQPAENPASLARLKLPGLPRGVIVIDVPPRPDGGAEVVRPQDIILRMDGFELDVQGDYNDPEYGHLMLENLSTRRKWAGDDVKLEVWREGKLLEVTYRLPKLQYTNSLVPTASYDRAPEYFILGGLVFQPLTDAYLQSWGAEWKRRAPFRLLHYRSESPSPARPALVLLSQVLPDAYNLGYQEHQIGRASCRERV